MFLLVILLCSRNVILARLGIRLAGNPRVGRISRRPVVTTNVCPSTEYPVLRSPNSYVQPNSPILHVLSGLFAHPCFSQSTLFGSIEP
ncbi:hypothetical protein V8C37DRAFT_389148 [Trichoderma ceciliae]